MSETFTSRDWALDLYDHGYQVVVAPLKGKSPVVAWKSYQTERIPRGTVEDWFSQGEHNLAIITGQISGVVVVDGDSAQACRYIEETCSPTPMIVQTSKGRHYYYRHPGTKIPNAARVLDIPPIDIRGDGGLVIGPGSIHPTGALYQLAPGCDLTPGPALPPYNEAWFPDARSAPETTFIRPILHFSGPAQKDAYGQAMRYTSNVPGAVQGAGGDNQTYVLACRLVRGFNLSDDEALDLLRAWNQHCTPPWEDVELVAKVKHARLYGTGEFGSMLAKARAVAGLLCYGWPS